MEKECLPEPVITTSGVGSTGSIMAWPSAEAGFKSLKQAAKTITAQSRPAASQLR